MANRRLYIVYGTGADAVGLVKSITSPIAGAGGNIVDLRQDVLHGLFTIFMVVDLSASDLGIDQFTRMVERIGEETNLNLVVDKYAPVARNPAKTNVLLILVGADRPGIIASISDALSKYKINIEFAKTVAREGIFLMELLTDISQCTIPEANLRSVLRAGMQAMGIETLFQFDDVFNKKKRAILFHLEASLIDPAVLREVLHQAGIAEAQLAEIYALERPGESLRAAASRLDRFPREVVDRIMDRVRPTPGTMELLQTLKTMGYRVGLLSSAFSFCTEALRRKLGLDYAFGVELAVDDDARTIVGELDDQALAGMSLPLVTRFLREREALAAEDVTVISDRTFTGVPGIGLEFDIEIMLEYLNTHVMNRENLIGLLGSLGIPRLG